MALHARMEAAEKALPGYAQFTARRTTLRDDIDRSEREARAARADIVSSFPDYVALSDPKPLSVAAAQALLRDDEVLVAILAGSAKSFVWALTRERAEWAEIDAGNATLAEHVNALRRGLDPLAQQDAEGAAGSRAGVVQGFDLNRAHALYKLVLGPVAGLVAGKRHLIVVPTGPLTSVPFQVLLTEPPGPHKGVAALRQRRVADQEPCAERAAFRAVSAGAAQADPCRHRGKAVLRGRRPGARGTRRHARSQAAQRAAYRRRRRRASTAMVSPMSGPCGS